ncbi:bifunctional DNA primase/polymerase [Streptomyces sp. NPDC001759]
MPPTYTTATGSGGVHHYFQWPAGADIGSGTSTSKIGLDLDTRGNGAQVVAPPSISDTGPYVTLLAIPVALPPAWLCALLQPRRPVHAPRGVADTTKPFVIDPTARAALADALQQRRRPS